MTLLLSLLALAFLLLSALHFYWALGGRWGFSSTIPTTEAGKSVLNPKWFYSALVGLALASFGGYYLALINTPSAIPSWILEWGGWVIGLIFLVRAMGDFKYVGFFKKIKSTSFGKRDSQYYSPLCLFIGLIALFLAWYF